KLAAFVPAPAEMEVGGVRDRQRRRAVSVSVLLHEALSRAPIPRGSARSVSLTWKLLPRTISASLVSSAERSRPVEWIVFDRGEDRTGDGRLARHRPHDCARFRRGG